MEILRTSNHVAIHSKQKESCRQLAGLARSAREVGMVSGDNICDSGDSGNDSGGDSGDDSGNASGDDSGDDTLCMFSKQKESCR